jgi:hypothetical protein
LKQAPRLFWQVLLFKKIYLKQLFMWRESTMMCL